jgi:microcystin-dependent protein
MPNFLNITKLYADDVVLTAAQLDAINTSIETFFNSTKLNDDNLQDGTISARKLQSVSSLDLFPVGSILTWTAKELPSGWLYCDGSVLDTTVYNELYLLIQTTYDPAGIDFKLPDLRGRVAAGVDRDNGDGLSGRLDNLSGIDEQILGADGGEEKVTLTTAQLPNHTHTHNEDGTTDETWTDGAQTKGDTHKHTGWTSINTVEPGGGMTYGHSDYLLPENSKGGSDFVRDFLTPQVGSGHVYNHTHDFNLSVNLTNHTHTYTASLGDLVQTSDEDHGNLQPMLICNKIIKY